MSLPEETIPKLNIDEPCNLNLLAPTKQELLREYQIRINFLSTGCVIEVGCKSIPFSTIEDGMRALYDYVNHPYETRKIWLEKFEK